MNNDNETRFRPTPPAFGLTNAEFANPWRPAEDLPLPPPPAGFTVSPSGAIREASPEELSDWVAEDILDGEFDD